MKSDLHDVGVIFQTETPNAVCVWEHETSRKDIWIPKSVCQFDGKRVPPQRGDEVILTAPEYVLLEKGLI